MSITAYCECGKELKSKIGTEDEGGRIRIDVSPCQCQRKRKAPAIEVWVDPKTGLEWQVNPSPSKVGWDDVDGYVSSLQLAGGGWRLPTKSELQGVSGKNRYGKRVKGFPGWYWSSTPIGEPGSLRWGVYYSDGYACYSHFRGYVRCVRDPKG